MKVKINTPIVGLDYTWKPKDIVTVSKAEGERLINLGLAEAVAEKKNAIPRPPRSPKPAKPSK